MKACVVEKSHNDMKAKHCYVICCTLHFMMWVADSQPKDLLTTGLLFCRWFGTGRWETCPKVAGMQVPTGQVSWIHAPTTTLTICCQELPMEMLTGFCKAAHILNRWLTWALKEMAAGCRSDLQSAWQETIWISLNSAMEERNLTLGVIKTNENHFKPKKWNNEVHHMNYSISSSERLQMSLLRRRRRYCILSNIYTSLLNLCTQQTTVPRQPNSFLLFSSIKRQSPTVWVRSDIWEFGISPWSFKGKEEARFLF